VLFLQNAPSGKKGTNLAKNRSFASEKAGAQAPVWLRVFHVEQRS
jgi:hypothetical protein